MAAVDTPGPVDLVRSSSQISTASSSRKSSTVRRRSTKRASNTSSPRASSPAADTKSLTSFPSLSPSPDSSPVQSRVNGWFRAALGDPGDKRSKVDRSEEIKPPNSPDTVKNVPPLELKKNDPGPSTVRKVSKTTQQIVGSLIATTPSTRERNALFDDTPQEPDRVPGVLHYASDDNISHLLERTGPVTLVRQLAVDVAQRDAQITALRRRAEERERILKKMLQECEVSNMDIEMRLRALDQSREEKDNGLKSNKRASETDLAGMHPEDDMSARLALAMDDDMLEYGNDGNAYPDIEVASVDSTAESRRETLKNNWKSYLFSGTSRKSSRAPSIASRIDEDVESHTQSGASSIARKSRKPISNDLFVPPEGGAGAVPTLRRLQSQDMQHSNSSSRRSSTSIAGWALKWVAGSGPGKGTERPGTLRGRNLMSSGNTTGRNASLDSTRTSQSTKGIVSNAKGRGAKTAMGPNGTIKSVGSDNTRNGQTNPVPPPLLDRGLGSLGPVEMERILPEESRPPTLVQHHNNFSQTSEYLTDRFGFIYDQRRKKRQSEAAAALAKQKRSSNVESLGDARSALNALGFRDDSEDVPSPPVDADDPSRTPSRPGSNSSSEQPNGQTAKTWQDYLKLATHPTELLSHTPSAAPITAVEVPDAPPVVSKSSQVTVAKRGSLPTSSANPEPSPSRIVSGNAEFATVSPFGTGPSSPIGPYFTHQSDPVKALLDQLTELHDSSQREKTVRWNDFLRKVRAERKREGEAASSSDGRSKSLTMPEALMTDGEIVGVASLGSKGKVGRAKWQEFRRLVLGGIPVAYRAKIWAECSGASTLRIPGYYDDLVNNGEEDTAVASQIQMDITRTLTDNIFFRKGPGVSKLNEVLIAYSRRNPEVGYCQGMNLITACLLLIMPTAEDAFWVLCTMIESILPPKYYDQHLLTSRADQVVLREYVQELLPKLSAHLDALDIELEALTFQWFLSVFTDCLSAEALFRVWDVVLCMHDGSTFLFQVALALLKLNERQLRDCDNPAAVYHYINHQMTNHAISIDGLIQASDALGKVVKRKDVEERRARAVEREQELMRQREELRSERARKRRGAGESCSMEEAREPSISASLDAELSLRTSPLRTPLSSAERRGLEEEDAEVLNRSLEELSDRTPLPVEEESLWRG